MDSSAFWEAQGLVVFLRFSGPPVQSDFLSPCVEAKVSTTSDEEPVLSAAQWAELSKQLPSPAAVFHARSSQKQRHFSGLQRLILSGVDHQQGPHAPDIELMSTGLSLSVLPIATATDVQVETRLWVTVAQALPTSVLRDADGEPLMDITTPVISTDHCEDVRQIPHGGAAIYRFGERAYALTAEVNLAGLANHHLPVVWEPLHRSREAVKENASLPQRNPKFPIPEADPGF